ncbi:transferase [Phaeosphaeriaceae sp. PMI808]|nr:transferase [Phaeosphaeriaceae sp. PMI808]
MTSNFRHSIPSERFPAQQGRYVLYFNYICPWAHRALLIRALKGLENCLQLVEVSGRDPNRGWYFSGRSGPGKDPIYGVSWLKELYLKADPHYNGRVTIPLVWDKQQDTIVSNDSTEITRMLCDGFDSLLAPEKREVNKGPAGLIPQHLLPEIDELNSWVHDTINNGVYKVGFAASQAAYNEHVAKLFESLDRLEHHLSEYGHQPYLFGEHITEADIRLFTTLIRFDIAYYSLFKCNLKMIRIDYPLLHTWLRTLYWSEGHETSGGVFKSTTHFDMIKRGYSSVMAGNGVVPVGPYPPIMPL